MFGRHWQLPHWGSDQPHPVRRQAAFMILVALLLATLVLLLLPPRAHGNFVYWANNGAAGSIGRAKINGTGANKTQTFLTFVPAGVAGVSNTDPIPVTLVKQRKKKK